MVDYNKVGLKVGLEIHRQIESHKLFCYCPSHFSEGTPDFTIKRHLHAVASETGEKDVVAEFEKGKGTYAVYEGFDETSCLVELDEEPVKLINNDALEVVLQASKMMHMTLVDEVQVMRKQVLDYSNTSSFQRTALVGVNGFIMVKGGKVGISSVCIEEDAARKIKVEKGHVVYRLDRLGIPLIEIATEPDMKTPQQAQEVATYLGMILKSTGRVKSGLGTIRQDLNVSIKGHPRVEIKGVQDLRNIPTLVEHEIKRQQQAIQRGKAESHVRKAHDDGSTSYLRPMPGAARMYVETDHPSFSVRDAYARITVPELLTEKAVRLERDYKLSAHVARGLLQEHKVDVFEEFVTSFNVDKEFIGKVLVDMPKEIKSRLQIDSSTLRKKDFSLVLDHVDKGTIDKSAVLEILSQLAQGKTINVKQFKAVDEGVLVKEIEKIVKKNKGASLNALMGEVMKVHRGKVDGKKVMEILKGLVE
jgi:Glu-tRNA(Gln) amidotransferase subunit E-like FAD-binding protein